MLRSSCRTSREESCCSVSLSGIGGTLPLSVVPFTDGTVRAVRLLDGNDCRCLEALDLHACVSVLTGSDERGRQPSVVLDEPQAYPDKVIESAVEASHGRGRDGVVAFQNPSVPRLQLAEGLRDLPVSGCQGRRIKFGHFLVDVREPRDGSRTLGRCLWFGS